MAEKMDYQLYSAIGAAGELFAIRTPLYEEMPEDTLLDDFMLSLRIAMKQYTIAYCDTAYALESGSTDMKEEEKRKYVSQQEDCSRLSFERTAKSSTLWNPQFSICLPPRTEMVGNPGCLVSALSLEYPAGCL